MGGFKNLSGEGFVVFVCRRFGLGIRKAFLVFKSSMLESRFCMELGCLTANWGGKAQKPRALV